MELDDGGLRAVRLGEREILRRVYVAVRDLRWGTVPMTLTNLVVDEKPDVFTVTIAARHQEGPIDFAWHGEIRGEASGSVSFRMAGEAKSTFLRNRIGLCVLHPTDDCAGRMCRMTRADGEVDEAPFPSLVAPHQPFFDIHRLAYEVDPGVRAEMTFEGEAFETEDQRNWSDDSYKTYSTPQRLPKPVEVKAGTRIDQTVTLRVSGAARPASAGPRTHDVVFTIDPTLTVALPRIGTALPTGCETLSALQRSRIRALALAHLRVELVPAQHDCGARLDRAIAESQALDLPLELAICVGGSPVQELRELAALLEDRRPRVVAYVILPTHGEVTPAQVARLARSILREVDKTAVLAGGSNLHFTEINRNRGCVEPLDIVAFPNSPQVHMVDEATLAENLAPLVSIARTARSFAGQRHLWLSPISLKPQPRPAPRLAASEGGPPRHVDERQTSLLAAAWTAAHVGQTARAGFSRATYFQAAGWLGLMPMVGGPVLPAPFAATEGVYPVWHALADLAVFAGGEVLVARSTRPLAVAGVVVRNAGRVRIALSNLTAQPQVVTIAPQPVDARVRMLDAATEAEARTSPESFRRSGDKLHASTIELSRYALATIDFAG